MKRILDQVYSSKGGVSLRFDMLSPEGDGPHPLVVCLHGGGWISGEKSDIHEIVSLLAGQGFAAAAPQYRLAPLYPFPAAVLDAMAFVRYARENHQELNIDAKRIGSMGNSAGGHLASMLGVLDRLPGEEPETPSARVQAVVDLCGISDVNDPRVQHNPIAWSFLEQFMEVGFEGNEDRYRLASPVSHVDSHAAPFVIFHGDADDVVPVDQSERMAAALRGHQIEVDYHCLPGEGHSFSYKSWPFIAQTAVQFLKRHLSA